MKKVWIMSLAGTAIVAATGLIAYGEFHSGTTKTAVAPSAQNTTQPSAPATQTQDSTNTTNTTEPTQPPVQPTPPVVTTTITKPPVISTPKPASQPIAKPPAQQTTPAQSPIQTDLAAGAKYMLTTQMSKMPEWTLVSTYAALGTRQTHTWTASDLSALATSTDVSKTILGVLAAGQDPHQIDGLNLVQKLEATQLTAGADAGKFADNMDGSGTDLINNQSWAIIALEDAGQATLSKDAQTAAATWLLAHQNVDGGFGYSVSWPSSDPDDTASAIEALSFLGYSAQTAPVENALKYLKTTQTNDGGFGSAATSNADSTGVVVDALQCLGIDPNTWKKPGGTPTSALLGFFDKSTGGFKYSNGTDSWDGVGGYSTRDALFGLGAVNSKQSIYQRLQVK